MGRLWQSKILSEVYPIFLYLPIETVIKKKQKEYYSILSSCDKVGKSTEFISFLLKIIKAELKNVLKIVPTKSMTSKDRIEQAKKFFGKNEFTRKDYRIEFTNISNPTASRDLSLGVKLNLLIKRGDKRLTVYKFR